MGRPRMIIIVRHAQSEGNKNRSIHQTTPDHRVRLTTNGWTQAEDAGRRLRGMLRPDDTLHFYTSPYRRTRETTEGILTSLTADDPTPSPFSRHTIQVHEEPRLREQDFGNFQPNSEEMERMWKERAEYGHFFYRIPNGESAADAYDRVSGFNETLWRSFSEHDFPSVCVLVTHGLMTRVFLMKWYHWSVEYFEDLRNIDHCEFIVMERTAESAGKYILKNTLRTWSELKRERERAAEESSHAPRDDHHTSKSQPRSVPNIPERTVWDPPRKQHEKRIGPRPDLAEEAFPPPQDVPPHPETTPQSLAARLKEVELGGVHKRHFPDYLEAGRDFGGSSSGAPTPRDSTILDQDSYWFSEDSQPADQQGDRKGMQSGAQADALGDQGEVDEQGKIEEMEERDKSIRGSVY